MKHIGTAISIQQQIYTNPVSHIEKGFFEDSLDIYKKMKSKLSEVDNIFREGALQGYTQVLMFNAYTLLNITGTRKSIPVLFRLFRRITSKNEV